MTRVARLARRLPPCCRWVACGGIHTLKPRGGNRCAVCNRDWRPTVGRQWLRVTGLRDRGARRSPPRALWILLGRGALVHWETRLGWSAHWTWRGDRHMCMLPPKISFGHRNISEEIRAERHAWSQPEQ